METKRRKHDVVDGRKWCSFHKCYETVDKFHKGNTGYQYICKVGRRVKNAEKRYDDVYTVYELSNGYIGITSALYNRLSYHKTKGRIKSVNDYKVRATTECKQEAMDLEALFQSNSSFYNYKPDSGNRLKRYA